MGGLPTFDVPARQTNPPGPDDPTWAVVCRSCGWHVEAIEGYCWRGCPECAGPLVVIWPDGSSMLADHWHHNFKAKRRRNAWRTGRPIVQLAA